jgi:hypothetical protein
LRYRIAIWSAGLLTFALVGAWFGLSARTTPSWGSSAVLGVLVGAVAVAAFVHVLDRSPQPRRVSRGRP